MRVLRYFFVIFILGSFTNANAALIANYHFDESSWNGTSGEVVDSQGNYNATAIGATTVAGTLSNRAGDFISDLNNDNYINLPSGILNGRTDFTFIAWVNIPSTSTGLNYLLSSTSEDFNIAFEYGDSTTEYLYVKINGVGKAITLTGDDLLIGKGWKQLAFSIYTVDGYAYVDVYVDKIQVGNTLSSGSWQATRSTGTIHLGQKLDDTRNLVGYLDEVRFYDEWLADSDVATIYDDINPPTPLSNYRYDECSIVGTTGQLADIGTANNDGTIDTAKAQLSISGKINGGVSASLDSQISVKSDLDITTNSGDQITTMFWMKWSGNANDDNEAPIYAGSWYGLRIKNGSFAFVGQINDPGYGIGAHSLKDSGWHHITAIFTDTTYTNNKLYIDGVEQTLTGSMDNSCAGGCGEIQTEIDMGILRFHGELDEVKIYDGALSTAEIQTIYNNEDAGNNYDGTTRASTPCSLQATDYFITTWNHAANETIEIPMIGTGYKVDWGDGTIETQDNTLSHNFTAAGPHTIKIYHPTPRIFFNGLDDDGNLTNPNALKIISINQWGTGVWQSMHSAFRGCSNLEDGNFTDKPDLSVVTNMYNIFAGASKFNHPINDWNVSNVTYMPYAFAGATKFNQDLNSWDMSHVTAINGMFESASDFNGNISEWNISNVTAIDSMFYKATSFDQDIGSWDISNVTSLAYMFYKATSFNQDIGGWDVSNITDMEGMFEGVTLSTFNYDQLLIGWDNQTLKNGVLFSGGGSKYCRGKDARAHMKTADGWTIEDSETEECLSPIPIADYHFDECSWNGTTGEVIDSTGEHNATSIGASLTGGVFNHGVKFDGIDDCIQQDDLYDTLKGTSSLSFWIKTTTQEGSNDPWNAPTIIGVDQSAGVDDIFWGFITSSGKIGISAKGGGSHGDSSINSTTHINNGLWHHIVFTRDASSGLCQVYVDGSHEYENTLDAGIIGTSFNKIGKLENGDGTERTFFKGSLDELKVFNYVLTANEISTIYSNSYSNSDRGTIFCPNDLVADYHFDECSWNGTTDEVKDSSANNSHGTSHFATISTDGKINNDGNFTKTNNSYVSSTLTSLDKNNWSFSCWVKIQPNTTDDSWQPILIAKSSSNTRHGTFSLWYQTKDNWLGAWFQQDSNKAAVGPNKKNIDIDDGNWHFLAATATTYDNDDDGTSDGTIFKLYVDGNHTTVDIEDFSNIPEDPSGDFWIGRTVDINDNNKVLQSDMLIDEVKVFNIALAKNQIKTIYDNEGLHKNYDGSHRMAIDCTIPTILAEYRFDECKYTGATKEVKDTNLSTGDNSGTIHNFDTEKISTTKDSERKSGRVLKLDGESIDIDNLAVNSEKYKKHTVMFWMKWDGTSKIIYSWGHSNLWFNNNLLGFNTDNSDNYGVSATGLSGSWHHIVAIFTNGDTYSNRIYIDGLEKTSWIIDGNLNNINANVNSTARIADWALGTGYNFKGYLDELKIYKGELNATTIASIHTYENTHERNITCAQAIFNAVNRAGGCFNWDNNITTKIVGADINLTILSADKNEANASLTDVNITQLDLLSFTNPTCEPSSLYATTEIWNGTDEVNSTTACWNPPSTVFKHPKAVRCARIKITGIYDGAVVESNSSDTFSIRPDKFVLSSATDLTQKLIAERDYTFWAKAVDIDGNVTDDFNTSVTQTTKKYFRDNTLATDVDMPGVFNPTTAFTFSDGNTSSTILNYNNVGKLSLDLNDTNWTITDNDDTLLADRTILLDQNLTFIPDRFDINFTKQPHMQNHENELFTYYSNDLANMAAVLKDINFTITARGEKGGLMSNYQNPQATYYAHNIKFSLGLDVDQNPSLLSPDINETNVVKDLNFSLGVATLGYDDLLFNFGRERNTTQNPRFLNGVNSKLNITAIDINDTEVNGTKEQTFDGDASFYYGRVRAKDIKTSDTTADANATIQVYSSSALSGFEQESSSWYVHKLDSFTVIGERDETKRKLTTDANISTFNITTGRGGFNILANPTNKSHKKFYHLSIPKWLWYSRYEDYNYTTGATCAEHPCFEYIFEYADEGKGIKSGSFKGAKFKGEFKSGVKKKAVKILR